MAYSLFLIGLGFLLTLEIDAGEQKELAVFSHISDLGYMLADYGFTGMQALLYLLMFFVIFQRLSARYKCKLY